MRRAVAAALALSMIGAAGCAPRPQRAEIVFWQFWPVETISPLLRKFETENPGLAVRVERFAREGARDTILAAVAAGAVPDLCELASTAMPELLASRALTDWSAGIADLRPTLRGWDMCSIGEAVYGVPWVLETRALFYNKMLLARAGRDSSRAPATWNDLARDAAAVQKLDRGVRGCGLSAGDRGRSFETFMPFIWGNGGEILSSGMDSSRFDSPETRAALAFYFGLRKLGTIGPRDSLDRDFERGRLGFEISGPWLCERISRNAPGLRYGVAVMPKPAADRGTHASFADGDVLVSFQAAKRKEAALRLARFLVRPDNALALAEAAPGIEPATAGADTTAFYRARPQRQMMIRQLELARFTPNHPQWDAIEAAIEDAVERALQDRGAAPESGAARGVAEADRQITGLLGKR